MTYIAIYKKVPGDIIFAICPIQDPLPTNCPIVAGNIKKVDANMTGITPA
jgi:hypothetical protein